MNGHPRRLRTLIILGVLVLALASLALLRWGWLQPAADQVRVEQDRRAIEQVLTDQDAAWNRGDLEGFMQGYWHSPDLTFFSGGEVRRGWDETLARYRQRYQGEGKEMGRLSFSDLSIDMVGLDAALVRGRWQVTTRKETLQGLFTLVMKRLPEGWRIVHDHTSS
jgi:ketosteroid isomerase-like protein